ncbi:Alcohol dehydrogenase superfamily zinc-containing [Macrophomina phaseolina MS6]|uniref:alcohol dehydrogenase (NADP(+)) n=2 Tax=Macrophomina phaseolina TaxID=35725 RepID=K2RNQ7_MACPH|nr:Alcohol dehydrogenase superfamily zinc-containing [Macrophomina phaseolina MS6]KAH7063739.1 chaperonin 10-like protein [Macrophomina phaseolina]
MADYKFEGWCGHGPESANGQMKWEEYKPKTWTEDDVDIKISHCGICGSDIHTLRSGWYPTPYPCVVGHEIIGKAVRVGKNVKHIKNGDRVGVGAQASSCLKPDCPMCSDGFENHCPHVVSTYGSVYPGSEEKSYGGYANYNRTPGHFVFKIPDEISSEHAAPVMCGGVTVYSPLKRYGAKGKRVGIVGLGGLGHFGVLFAKALDASEVVVISRSHAKEEDAKKLGADRFIATADEGWDQGTNFASLDLIVSTVSSDKMPLAGYLNLLSFRGTFVQVGAPEDPLPAFPAFSLIMKAAHITGSAIGSPKEIEEMLQLIAEKGIKPWTQEIPLKDANQAVIDFEAGKPRYRFVLKNENYTD